MSAPVRLPKVRVRFVPRERDEEVLRWLDLHLNQGVSMAEIARREGVKSYQSVQLALKPVIEEMEAGNA